jgi:uncharacterized protein (UPF0332 family)
MVQAVETLADAKALLTLERSGRSIVNRSYYALFYGVLALLQTIRRIPRKHQGAISLFDREFVHTGLLSKDLSADLHRLFETRQQDDYLRLEPVDLAEARAAIKTAERFLQAIHAYLTRIGYHLDDLDVTRGE